MSIRWFSVMQEHDGGPRDNFTLPAIAPSLDAVLKDATDALERYAVPQRWRPIPLVDPLSTPDTEQEMLRLVLAVPLFDAIFKYGRRVERTGRQSAGNWPAGTSQSLSLPPGWDDWDLKRQPESFKRGMFGHVPGGEFVNRQGQPTDCDPTYGRIDADIQRAVQLTYEPDSVAQRVAIENTMQAKRDQGLELWFETVED